MRLVRQELRDQLVDRVSAVTREQLVLLVRLDCLELLGPMD